MARTATPDENLTNMSLHPARDPIIPAEYYQDFLKENDASAELALNRKISKIFWARLGQAGLLRFGALAAVFPLDSIRLLRQVHYTGVPDVAEKSSASTASGSEKTSPPDSGSDTDDMFSLRASERKLRSRASEADVFYKARFELPMPSIDSLTLKHPADIAKDESGYIVSAESLAEKAGPAYSLGLGKSQSLWASFVAMVRQNGVFSVWQGVVSFWSYSVTHDMVLSGLEYTIRSYRLDESALGVDRLPYPSMLASVAACALANYILTPLDIARTRLVAQSVHSREAVTRSLPVAVSKIYQHDGGWAGLYPRSLLTILSAVIAPMLRIVPISVFTHYCEGRIAAATGVSPEIIYPVAQYLFHTASLLLVLPLETIRRRLQLQDGRRMWRYRVRMPDTPYAGPFDCLRRIIREEGIAALYQGWQSHVAAHTAWLAANVLLAYESEFPDDSDAF